MLKKLLIAGIIVAVFVVVIINVPYVYEEYNEDNLIVQNTTGWDREIFSDYKKFELKYDEIPLLIIPYQLDVNINNAYIDESHMPIYAISMVFDSPTNNTIMDILLPKTITAEYPDMIFHSADFNSAYHSPITYVKDYNTHTHYKIPLYQNLESHLILGDGKHSGALRLDLESLGTTPSFVYTLDHLDYFPPLSHQQRSAISLEDDLQCPKDFDLVFDSKTPKCIKSEYLIKLIENKLKN